MKTENGKFYVAKCYGLYVSPAIVEAFDSEVDAESYALLMSRTKNQTYIVLEFKTAVITEEENGYYAGVWDK